MYVKKTKQKKLGKQTMNTCSYSPVTPNTLELDTKNNLIRIITPHDFCTHSHYCMFNDNTIRLEQQIMDLEKELLEFENVKEEAINGNIIYRPELDNEYTIEKHYYTGVDGRKHCKIDVQVSDRFLNLVNVKSRNLRYDLENTLKFQKDIMHGKIGGYGHGD